MRKLEWPPREGCRWSSHTEVLPKMSPFLAHLTILRAMKEKTDMAVNIMVGMSITTAEPTLVPKKAIAAIQPL